MSRQATRLFGRLLLMSSGVTIDNCINYAETKDGNVDVDKKERFRRILAPSVASGHQASANSLSNYANDILNNKKLTYEWKFRKYEVEYSDYARRWTRLLSLFINEDECAVFLHPVSSGDPTFSRDLIVEQDCVPIDTLFHQFLYEGYVQGDPHSRVFGCLIDGIFDGNIFLSDGQNFTFENATKFAAQTSLDLDFHNNQDNVDRARLYAPNVNQYRVDNLFWEKFVPEFNEYLRIRFIEKRRRKKIQQEKTCTMHLKADHKLYQEIMRKEGNNDPKRTRDAIVGMFYNHIRVVNDKFAKSNFDIRFVVKKISIETRNDQDPLDKEDEISGESRTFKTIYRMYSAFKRKYSPEECLEHVSKEDHSAYCLTYAFTFRRFGKNALGIAQNAKIGLLGGMCCPFAPVRGEHRSYNIGMVTMHCPNASTFPLKQGHFGRRYVPPHNGRLPASSTQWTLAHEIGHSLGASHDEPEDEKDGKFIMTSVNPSAGQPCKPVFSDRSKAEISAFLDALQRIEPYAPADNGHIRPNRNCLL